MVSNPSQLCTLLTWMKNHSQMPAQKLQNTFWGPSLLSWKNLKIGTYSKSTPCSYRGAESQIKPGRHPRWVLVTSRTKVPKQQPKNSRQTSGVTRQTKPKKGQFMKISQGHSGRKGQCESCLFSQGKTPEFTKMGEIHELFVLPLSLVWFAGATPENGLFFGCFWVFFSSNSWGPNWHPFRVFSRLSS